MVVVTAEKKDKNVTSEAYRLKATQENKSILALQRVAFLDVTTAEKQNDEVFHWTKVGYL